MVEKSSPIVFRQCHRDDWPGILDICYKTGFMGEDLTGSERFKDRKLFGYLFCLYYVRFEADHCFVALDKDNDGKIVGYILGSGDTQKYQKKFFRKMFPFFIPRLFLYSWWRYPESYRQVMQWRKLTGSEDQKEIQRTYPAHLHINILPQYQRRGIGRSLMRLFESRMKSLGIQGIHLITTNYNTRALPFYRQHGYSVLLQKNEIFWSGIHDCKKTIFGKKLVLQS